MHGWERESMALPESSSYHLHWGFKIDGSESASVSVPHNGLQSTSNFGSLINPDISFQSPVRDSPLGLAFPLENSSLVFSHSPPNGTGVPDNVPNGESGKRKRGRPRKYAPNGADMSLKAASPMSSTPPAGSITPTPKKGRGRPRGSGWRQQLAPLGDWMNSSAGLAFTPHVINIAAGEDILAKIVLFSQQKPRALCIMSASGSVSSVTLRQSGLDSKATYEGFYEILRLSGSYLVQESGDRTGGLSVALSGPDGEVIGGGVGGELIAASPVQVVVGSFVYGGGSKSRNKVVSAAADEQKPELQSGGKSTGPESDALDPDDVTPISAPVPWPSSTPDMRNPKAEIDLTWG